jgi:DNA repair exonuclease SbcCD ATPase subunit
MTLTGSVRGTNIVNVFRKLEMRKKKLESTPENIQMSETLRKTAGITSAITQGHKCPVCNSWINRKNKGVCMPCYIKRKQNE